MTIKTVKYERLFPCGAYLNEKIGFEAEIGTIQGEPFDVEGKTFYQTVIETPEMVIEKLRQLSENIHKEKYPQFYIDESSQKENPPPPEESPIASHIKTINECKTLNNLKIFEKLVTNAKNDDLSNAYMKQHEKLYLQSKTKTP